MTNEPVQEVPVVESEEVSDLSEQIPVVEEATVVEEVPVVEVVPVVEPSFAEKLDVALSDLAGAFVDVRAAKSSEATEQEAVKRAEDALYRAQDSYFDAQSNKLSKESTVSVSIDSLVNILRQWQADNA